MFLAGVPSTIGSTGLRTGAERTSQSFNGCIHNVRINGELQDLSTGLTGTEGILPGCHSCTVCAQGPCRQRAEAGVTCECPASSSGPLCEQQSYINPCQSSRYCNPILKTCTLIMSSFVHGSNLTLHGAEKVVRVL